MELQEPSAHCPDAVFIEDTAVVLDEVAPDEPFAANALRIGSRLCLVEGAPRTAARVRQAGLSPELLALDELAKAEAGLTCLSLLFAT